MMEAIISLVIALVVVGIVWYVFKWIVGAVGVSGPFIEIGNLVFGAVVLILVLRFLTTLL